MSKKTVSEETFILVCLLAPIVAFVVTLAVVVVVSAVP